MKAIRATNNGKGFTGHMVDEDMYEKVKHGELAWKPHIKECITHYAVPAEVFERLLKLDLEQGSWRPVDEQPPEDGQYCIIYTKIHFIPDHVDEPDYYWDMELSRYYKDFGFSSANGIYAKYWMPRPDAPKEVLV